jgi:tetrahydromethanopterin S-methyltransferase subunit B
MAKTLLQTQIRLISPTTDASYEIQGEIGIVIDHVIGMLTENCNEIVVKAFDSASKKILRIEDISAEVEAVYSFQAPSASN